MFSNIIKPTVLVNAGEGKEEEDDDEEEEEEDEDEVEATERALEGNLHFGRRGNTEMIRLKKEGYDDRYLSNHIILSALLLQFLEIFKNIFPAGSLIHEPFCGTNVLV
jgi:hypothetical protein